MSNSDDASGCLSAIVLAIVGVYFLWHSKWYYAMRYGISATHVLIDPKPHDCDFMKAPMGDKECSYKRIVSTVEWAKSQTNTPIVSFDGGKTWSGFTPDPQTYVPQFPTVVSVEVSWEKATTDGN